MKNDNSGCRVDVLVQQQRWSDALPLLPSLDRVASLAGGGAGIGLYHAAAAEVYRQCDMPSRAAAAMRRAAAALRQAAMEAFFRKKDFQNAGLCMEPDRLEASARTLEKLVERRRVAEADMPPIPAHLPALRGLRLPVRCCVSRARDRCSCAIMTLTLPLTQLAEADLLPTTLSVLRAPAARQLPRVAACKLTLPHARADTVKSEHYAIIGCTLLLRDCPLRSQPLLLLPEGKELQLPSSGVKLPRIEALAECRQAAAAAVAGAASPLT